MLQHWSPQAVDVVGYLAACLTTAAWLPQLFRTWRLRSADDLSPGMLGIFTGGVALWLLFGLARESRPVIVANAATLVLSLVLIAMRFAFRQRR